MGRTTRSAGRRRGQETSSRGTATTGCRSPGQAPPATSLQGNMIGIGANGNSSTNYSNGRFGILVNFQASHNLIGTNGDGVNDGLERNLISGNSSWGIEISDPGTQQ